jgi:hypothetical protein
MDFLRHRLKPRGGPSDIAEGDRYAASHDRFVDRDCASWTRHPPAAETRVHPSRSQDVLPAALASARRQNRKDLHEAVVCGAITIERCSSRRARRRQCWLDDRERVIASAICSASGRCGMPATAGASTPRVARLAARDVERYCRLHSGRSSRSAAETVGYVAVTGA